ncbi:Uncharacterized membrane protein YdjX, TVP38/TMEM64 family, SNARE-associated domain [Tindallia magadiensis]|uniref:TVP38/TMEM64 family membrane protein n=1 Tax=Tindallia magadiensis TaxID=69895 RepID=A0A1I3GSA6_9FIRM|nr:VTT domain-containing protein [Tindallia magadiensis]SFI26202.1 Uncharacterized membrane protein YdjX, TVP38/TMEM64 family, SNARE-associated domain [Tindallia magadiensis]
MSLHINGKKIFQGLFILVLSSAIFFNIRNPIDLFHWSQSNYKSLSHFVDQHLLLAMLIFFLVRFFFAVVSIPGTGVLTLLAGALFGFYIGSLLVLLAVSSGVLVAFLLTRYFFKEPLKHQFRKQFQYIDTLGLRYGSSLLFFLRLSEFTPSVVINSFFALTPMKASTYFRVSLISIVPGVLLFTNAGLQLSEIQQPSDFFNINILITLVVIGLLPILCEYIYLRHQHDPE